MLGGTQIDVLPRSIFLVSQIPLVEHHISTPRSLPLHWIEVSLDTLLGRPTHGFCAETGGTGIIKPVAPEFAQVL